MVKNKNVLNKKDKINQFINKILLGDSIEIMKEIPENSIDLIFADPPYNLQLQGDLWRPNQTKVDAVDDEWDHFNSFQEYDNFTEKWLKECKRIMKESGSIWIIGSYHNVFRIGKIMQDLGFWILNDILWIKTNPMPNFMGTRFNNAHETLIWATKSQNPKYTFNYKTMKSYNDDLQMRSDWYIPICQGTERIRINGKKAHSTQKPEALLYRIIISSSSAGDVVLDPFSGTGTTLAVAKKLGRNYIGIEKDDEYLQIIKNRLAKIEEIDNKILQNLLDVKIPRVPFGCLIEKGIVKPGEFIFSRDKEDIAQVLANGTIMYKEYVGSIHSISAKILNKPKSNGWDFWYVERNTKLICLSILRTEYVNCYTPTKGAPRFNR
jgi:DNA modification methylase